MTTHEIESAIEIVSNKLLPAYENMYWKGEKEHPEKLEQIRCLQTLLSVAQLFLEVQERMPKKKDFEDYLMEKHAEQYIGTKDCMIDDFNKWVQDVGVDELIEYANKLNNFYHDEITAHLAGKVEGIENFLKENIRIDMSICIGGEGTSQKLNDEGYRRLAQAIKYYLLKGE